VKIGIVLAAGLGRRIGGPKALLNLDGRTFLQRAVDALSGAGLQVVAVINPAVDELTTGSDFQGRRIVNPSPDDESGMFGSVRLGASEGLRLGAGAAVLLPVDLPLVTREDVQAVERALSAKWAIAVGTHGGRWGHPIAINRAVMEEVVASGSATTLRDIVRRDRARVVEVEVSEGAILGINTREDLERASKRPFR
jgi:nicotine blue oxidoreductase